VTEENKPENEEKEKEKEGNFFARLVFVHVSFFFPIPWCPS
jgi:hypothetical protein